MPGFQGGRQGLKYFRQKDFRGGICTEPENARPNQVIDALNVWCPEGRLEQRPGYWGVAAALSSAASYSTTGTFPRLVVDGTSYNLSSASTNISFATVDEGEYWYFGFFDSPYITGYVGSTLSVGFYNSVGVSNTALTIAQWQYWNGSIWKKLNVQEGTAFHGWNFYAGNITLNFVYPNDWVGTEVDSNLRYWVRARIQQADFSAGTVMDLQSGNNSVARAYTATTSKVAIGLFKIPFGSGVRYSQLEGRVGSVIYATSFTSEDLLKLSSSSVATVIYTQNAEPPSFATVPDYDDAYISYATQSYRFTYDAPLGVATVEDAPEYVGTINGIQSDYHPDQIAWSPTFPQGKYLAFFQGQIFVAALKESDVAYRWSAVAPAHRVWPETSFNTVMDGGDKIAGLATFNENLLLLKERSLWQIVNSGTDENGLNIYDSKLLVSGKGCASNASIAETPLGLMYLGNEGVYVFNGVDAQILTGNIDSVIERINPSQRKFAVGVHWPEKKCYLLAVALDGSLFNSHVILVDYKHLTADEEGRQTPAIWIWDNINVCSWIHDNGQMYFLDQFGSYFKFQNQESDYGATPEVYVKTHRFGVDKGVDHSFRDVVVNADNNLASLNVELIVDDRPSGTSGTITLTDPAEDLYGTGTWGTAVWWTDARRRKALRYRETGEWCQLKVSNTTKGVPMRLNEVSVGALQLGSR
jgi:hypothetical protein